MQGTECTDAINTSTFSLRGDVSILCSLHLDTEFFVGTKSLRLLNLLLNFQNLLSKIVLEFSSELAKENSVDDLVKNLNQTQRQSIKFVT